MPPNANTIGAIRKLLDLQLPVLRVHVHVRILMNNAVGFDPAAAAERAVLLTALAREAGPGAMEKAAGVLRKLVDERDKALRELGGMLAGYVGHMDNPAERMDDAALQAWLPYFHEHLKAAAEMDASVMPWFMWVDLMLSNVIPETPPASLPNGVPGIIKFPRKGDGAAGGAP